jgi:hypothetical protein
MDIQIGQLYGFYDEDAFEGVYRVENLLDGLDGHVILVNIDDAADQAMCQRPRFETEIENGTWVLFP